MEDKLKKILTDGVSQIDPDLNNEEFLSKLETFYNQIILFNPVYKLVAATPEEIITRHILDSLAPYKIIRENAKGFTDFADLGSGSGFPGFVLASAMKDCHFSLVDKMGRRAGFLRNTVAMTKMKDFVTICESEVEKLDRTFECIVFRAFKPLEDIIATLDRITNKDSVVFAYKSSDENIEKEIETVKTYGKFTTQICTYAVPFLDAKRSLLILTRK